MIKKAVIFGIKGTKLSRKERIFFQKVKPWGVILFTRNIKNINQLASLTKSIRTVVKNNKYPIMIDQEGGTVSRLNKIFDFSTFSQNYFANLYRLNPKLFFIYYKIYINAVSGILKRVGININTVPVLDLQKKYSHKIIGSRAYSYKPSIVKKLGRLCIKFFEKNKIATVVKHLPGHGSALSDSHFRTPKITLSKKKLIENDFRAFKSVQSQFAMTAHCIYSSYDNKETATHSKIVINNIIRKHINFKGILISDDISMKSLKYNLNINAKKAFLAGCNLVLHCNGNLAEMRKLVKSIPNINKFTQKKTSQFYKFLG